MTDAERAKHEADTLDIERRILAVVNDPDAGMADVPYALANALMRILAAVMATMMATRPDDGVFCRELLRQLGLQSMPTPTTPNASTPILH